MTISTSVHAPTSDADLLDILRTMGALGVSDLAVQLEVTPTAVRQRLMRLLAQGLIEREAIRKGPGRPRHLYRLSDKGLRLTGSNFADLALALWREMGTSGDDFHQRQLVRRVAATLAAEYVDQVRGQTTGERMRSLATLLGQRRVRVSVAEYARQLILTAHACPYPKLADRDRRVCEMEAMLYSELLGQEVHLTHCRLDGDDGCRFQAEAVNTRDGSDSSAIRGPIGPRGFSGNGH